MSKSGENRIWSPEDIVNNASNWSLAADKELLRHLHNLSEKILSDAAKANDNLVELIDSLHRTGLSLDLANIELENLHHTQFIESRVYDDDDEFEADETTDIQVKVDKKADDEKTRREIEEGLLLAVKAVEEYYEYKEVPNSDSDDETDSPNFVWQPKDPYLTRPLPCVIGTTEWYRKWHVGLLHDSSDDEDVKTAKTVIEDDVNSQSSDDDRYLPRLDRKSTIPSNNQNNEWRPSVKIDIPMANSTLAPDTGLFSENGGSLPTQEANLSFADQLATKLGNIAHAQESAHMPQINTRPMKNAPTNTHVNVFFDEPPPIGDSDSSDDAMLFGNAGSVGGGLFARSVAGLFDDAAENGTKSGDNSNITKQNGADVKKIKSSVSNIFDSETEDDLFAAKPVDKVGTFLPARKSYTAMPLFDDEPPALPLKKPVGGVAIFGNADIVKLAQSSNTEELHVASLIKKSPQQNKNENITQTNKPELISNKELAETKHAQINTHITKEHVNLFDDVDNLFEDDLFSNTSSNKFTSSLFDDDYIVDANDSSSLFYTSTVKIDDKTNLTHNSKPKNSHLNDDLAKKTDSSLFYTSAVKIDENTNLTHNSKPKNSHLNDDLAKKTDSTNAKNRNKNKFDSSRHVKSDISKSESLFDDLTAVSVDRLGLYDDEIDKNDVTFSDRSVFNSCTVGNNQQEVTKRRNLFDDDVLASATLPDAQIAVDLEKSRIKANLFDDFDEAFSLFNDYSFVGSEEVDKIDGSVKVEVKKQQILEEITKKIDSTEILQEIIADKSVIFDNQSKSLTDMSLLDTPPDIGDDFDTDSENNLFNDENHLIFGDNSQELSAPVYKSSIFDEEPPLLPSDDAQYKKINLLRSTEATSSDSELNVSNILTVPQSKRNNVSIHERLNNIETSDVSKMTDELKDCKKMFSDSSVLKNTSELLKQIPSEHLDNCSSRKLGVPGKIKHNLNINVSALLPVSCIKPDMLQTRRENASTPNLDEFDGKTEILPCITKDRAKIPVKRRPSTRKARIEATANSHEENNNKLIPNDVKTQRIDAINQNTLELAANSLDNTTQIKGAVKKTKQPSLFASSDSSDSDDIFKTKPLPSANTQAKKFSDVFNGLKAPSLFDKQPVIKGDVFESPDYKKSKIFFDDDDDYFSAKKLPPKSNIMKKSLFDDEEDLFQANLFKNDLKPAKISGAVKKPAKTTCLFTRTDDVDDPLDLFK